MIYDSFMYAGEHSLLEIRLEELWNVVDKFVLAESPFTFQSKPKPLYFAENLAKFEKYNDKILYLEIDSHPNLGKDRRAVEYPMREFFVSNMDFQDDDIFLISDVDEIPKWDVLKDTIENIEEYDGVCKLSYTSCCYYVNCASDEKWWGPLVIKGKRLRNLDMTLGIFRDMKAEELNVCETSNAGWHFAYIGTPEQLSEKMKRHYILSGRYTDVRYISKRKENLQDLYRPYIKYNIDNDMELPKYLMDNREKFSHMFYEEK